MADKKENQLSLWAKGAASRKALVSYVDSVTDKNSPDFIPVNNRIAVFDLDGICSVSRIPHGSIL